MSVNIIRTFMTDLEPINIDQSNTKYPHEYTPLEKKQIQSQDDYIKLKSAIDEYKYYINKVKYCYNIGQQALKCATAVSIFI